MMCTELNIAIYTFQVFILDFSIYGVKARMFYVQLLKVAYRTDLRLSYNVCMTI